MLPLDVGRAAHLARDRLAPPNLVDLRLPAHSVTLYAEWMWHLALTTGSLESLEKIQRPVAYARGSERCFMF
jgi:hypothetical protein